MYFHENFTGPLFSGAKSRNNQNALEKGMNEYMMVYPQTVEYNAIVKINKITVNVTTWQWDLFSCSGVRKASLRS